MKITETAVAGAFLLDPDRIEDERGFFARSWCREEMEAQGLDTGLEQCNISYNTVKGTVRGLHYQAPPHAEVKIVRCTMGAIYDVLVDIRPGSRSAGRWTAVELTAQNRLSLYIPAGVAHGYQTLVAGSEVFYLLSETYASASARGIRWNDPALAIAWPLTMTVISERDAAWPLSRSAGA